MSKKKLLYQAPEAEAFVVRFERGLCESTTVSGVKGRKTYDEEIDLDEYYN